MLGRNFGGAQNNNKNQSVKNQQMSITITKTGKTYAICSKGQMEYLIASTKEKVLCDFYEKKIENYTQEDVDKKVKEEVEKLEYATIDQVLAQLTPQEVEDFKIKYRFSGVRRKF